MRIDGKSKRAQPERMESHPAWVKRLRMASIWTRSGHETYIERKKRDLLQRRVISFPQRQKTLGPLGYAFSFTQRERQTERERERE